MNAGDNYNRPKVKTIRCLSEVKALLRTSVATGDVERKSGYIGEHPA